jgi:hypothetical protein
MTLLEACLEEDRVIFHGSLEDSIIIIIMKKKKWFKVDQVEVKIKMIHL